MFILKSIVKLFLHHSFYVKSSSKSIIEKHHRPQQFPSPVPRQQLATIVCELVFLDGFTGFGYKVTGGLYVKFEAGGLYVKFEAGGLYVQFNGISFTTRTK